MKRISEVFKGEPCGFSTRMTDEQVRHGQHAINHADALADALDECLEDMELEGKHDDRVYKLAKAALAAYRGDK